MNRHQEAATLTFCGIDFEGSGSTAEIPDAPIQIGLAKLHPQEGISILLNSYLDPKRKITDFAWRIHKIGYRQTSGAPQLRSFYSTITTLARETVFAAHAPSTEKRFLNEAFPIFAGQRPSLPIEWVDTLKLARAVYPKLPNHRLQTCVEAAGVIEQLNTLVPKRGWHDALYDATATLLLLQHCLQKPGLKGATLFQLQQLKKNPPKKP